MQMRYAMAGAAMVMMLAATGQAEIVTKTVEYQDGDTTLVGYIAYDDAVEGKRPGVLVFHAWMGQGEYEQKRARQLAAMGYVAFAADMYGEGKRAESRQQAAQWSSAVKNNPELARRRTALALTQLKGHDLVDDSRTAAIGYCFGGTMVLELARSGAEINGVVSFHGGLGTKALAKKDAVKASVLVCHGAADPYVPPAEVAAFKKEMDDAGVDWVLAEYAGAVHSFTHDYLVGDKASAGAAYDEKADKRSWRHMQAMFDELFALEKEAGDQANKAELPEGALVFQIRRDGTVLYEGLEVELEEVTRLVAGEKGEPVGLEVLDRKTDAGKVIFVVDAIMAGKPESIRFSAMPKD